MISEQDLKDLFERFRDYKEKYQAAKLRNDILEKEIEELQVELEVITDAFNKKNTYSDRTISRRYRHLPTNIISDNGTTSGPHAIIAAPTIFTEDNIVKGNSNPILFLRRNQISPDDYGYSNDGDIAPSATMTHSSPISIILHLVKLDYYFKLFKEKTTPLTKDLHAIEAKYGSSVVSYFEFYQWIITTYVWLAIVTIILVILHFLNLYEKKNSSSSSPSQVLELISFQKTTILPYFTVYSSFSVDERYTYAIFLLVVFALLLYLALLKWVREDRRSKLLTLKDEELHHIKFTRALLGEWDFTLSNSKEISLLKQSLTQNLILLLEEAKSKKATEKRTRYEIFISYTRKFIGILLYVLLQTILGLLIIYLTAQSQNLSMIIAEFNEDWESFASSIVPATVSIINTIMPILIKALTDFERWESQKVAIKQLVFRMYLSKILNLMLQVLSFMLLANPYMWSRMNIYNDLRQNLAKNYTPESGSSGLCRADKVGLGLYQIIITEFIMSKFIALSTKWGEYFFYYNIYYLKWKGATKKDKDNTENNKKDNTDDVSDNSSNGNNENKDNNYTTLPITPTKSEFDVAGKTVSLLYFQGVIFATLPWLPLTTPIILLLFYINFKFDNFFLHHYEKKPEKPWKAQDSGLFYIKFYLNTLLIIGFVSIYFFFSTESFPKNCEIQDTNIGLCVNNTIAPFTTCPINRESEYYTYFMIKNGNNCNTSSYPGCLCSGFQSCGPFTDSSTNFYGGIVSFLSLNSLVNFLYQHLLTNILFYITLLIITGLRLKFRANTMIQNKVLFQNKNNKNLELVRDTKNNLLTMEKKYKKALSNTSVDRNKFQ